MAQTQLDAISGAANAFGHSVAFVGDIDGDGHDEWVVGAYTDDSAGVNAGRAQVFDGASGIPLYTFDGEAELARLGQSVAGAGLVDADAVPDIVIGSPGRFGRALVVSGATGLPIWDIAGTVYGQTFGSFVCGAGDFDNDGRDDFAVAERAGATLYVYSGATGGLIFSDTRDGLISDIDGAGDWNGDGFDDIVIGRGTFSGPGGEREGVVRVHLGPSGAIGLEREGGVPCLDYGDSVARAGDVNGDGKDDILVGGTANLCFTVYSTGRMDLLAGDNGVLLERWEGSTAQGRFGDAVTPAGDVDLDGVLDLATVESFSGTDLVCVYSGADGRLIASFDDTAAGAPLSLAAGGDVNADGYPDFLVGDRTGAGEVRIWTLGCPANAGYTVCESAINSVGRRTRIGFQNSLSVSANSTRLFATGAPPDRSGLFFYGRSSIQVPFGDGFGCVGGNTFRLPGVNTGTNGAPTYDLDITTPPQSAGQIEPGDTWYFQFRYRDPLGPGGTGFNASDALMATFCP